MTKYSELLKHPKWQKKRLAILNRDDFSCCLCQDRETTLNVHHTEYKNFNAPWDIEDCLLVTLCEHCHRVIEDLKSVDFDTYKIVKKKSTNHIYLDVYGYDKRGKYFCILIYSIIDNDIFFNLKIQHKSLVKHVEILTEIVEFNKHIVNNG